MCKKLILVMLCGTCLAGCAATMTSNAKERFDAGEPLFSGLRIGLLADSQFQTPRSHNGLEFMRGKMSDALVNVSIRPAALNKFAPTLLEYFLEELQKEKVGVVFYLGDAANNGCKDEITEVFKRLRAFRERYQKPVFFVLGNHDYLGAGNTPFVEDRLALCSDNPKDNGSIYSKFELMELIHSFNRESAELGKPLWTYFDSLDSDEKGKPTRADRCGNDSKLQHNRMGCFLAGVLKYSDGNNGKAEFLLLDTSDYFDKQWHPDFGDKSYYGAMGWLSTRMICGFDNEKCDTQLNWFLDHSDIANSKKVDTIAARILLSHYPKEELGPIARKFNGNEGLIRRMDALFTPGALGTFWISAHTHRPEPKISVDELPLPTSITPGQKASVWVQQLNIGSTTDFEPHAVVAGILAKPVSDGDGDSESNMVIKKVTLPEQSCQPVFDYITEHQKEREANGIDTSYKGLFWISHNADYAVRYLDSFADKVSTSTNVPVSLVKACFALKAARYERGIDEIGMKPRPEIDYN